MLGWSFWVHITLVSSYLNKWTTRCCFLATYVNLYYILMQFVMPIVDSLLPRSTSCDKTVGANVDNWKCVVMSHKWQLTSGLIWDQCLRPVHAVHQSELTDGIVLVVKLKKFSLCSGILSVSLSPCIHTHHRGCALIRDVLIYLSVEYKVYFFCQSDLARNVNA